MIGLHYPVDNDIAIFPVPGKEPQGRIGGRLNNTHVMNKT